MMFEDITGTRIAQINCDDGQFDITQDKLARCFFNRSALFTIKSDDTFASMVSVLVRSACRRPNADVKIKSNPSYSDFLKKLVDTLSKSDQVKIHVLDEKPDEKADNKPKELVFSFDNLDEFRNRIRVFAEFLDNGLSMSEILLKTKLPKNMVESKEVHKTFSSLKSASEDLIKNRETLEIVAEQTDIKAGKLICLKQRYVETPKSKQVIQAGTDHIINNFLMIKKMLATFIVAYFKLYDINQLFKKYTGYPATWFFDPTVFYNFAENYEDVSDGLIESAQMESSVIKPLYAWKVKVTGE